MMQTSLPFQIPVKRGCGVRIEGGIYLVTTAEIEELVDYLDLTEDAGISGKLVLFPKPYPTLTTLKPFRGFRGFDKDRFFKDLQNADLITPKHRIRVKNCYYTKPEESRAYLHWIGNQYYSINSFIEEAKLIGISRRVPRKVLKKMKWGDSIFLASKQKGLKNPVIFGYFKLDRIQGVKVNIKELPNHLQNKMRYEKVDF